MWSGTDTVKKLFSSETQRGNSSGSSSGPRKDVTSTSQVQTVQGSTQSRPFTVTRKEPPVSSQGSGPKPSGGGSSTTESGTGSKLDPSKVRKKAGAAEGFKLEVGAGDFSTDRKTRNFYKEKGGDVITELVAGTDETEWGKRQRLNILALKGRGAHPFVGIDVTRLPEAMGQMFGTSAPPLRKLKLENPANTKEDKKKRDKGITNSGLSYGDIFANANATLAPLGVLEWGLTGPTEFYFQNKNMGPVRSEAKKAGFELVEQRTKTAKSHTFSQESRGMEKLGLSQYVFARQSEAQAVRAYTLGRMATKTEGAVTDGQVGYDGKTRKLIPRESQ